jgi:hypothetical protein
LTAAQESFLGALEGLPDLVRGADLVDRASWDVTPPPGSAPDPDRD